MWVVVRAVGRTFVILRAASIRTIQPMQSLQQARREGVFWKKNCGVIAGCLKGALINTSNV